MTAPCSVSLASSSTFGKVWRRIVGNTYQESDPLSLVDEDGEFLSFGVYAARRLLNTCAVSQEQAQDSEVFEAVRTLSCMYLRADVQGFTDCIEAFELDSFLATKVLEYDVFKSESTNTGIRRQSSLNLVVDFLHLLEALMLEYLSDSWDKVDKLFGANEADLQDEGMSCTWKPKPKESVGTENGASAQNRARANWKRAYRVAIKQVTMNALGTQRKFRTFAQMALELQRERNAKAESTDYDKRSREQGPILLLLGGGMAAGKSTVREIIGSDHFWSKVCKDAVIVEADAIKNQDVIFKVLSGRLGNDPSVSSLVHEYSTSAAENMLAAAVNGQKDIVFDGTMTWLPFVEQTIAMVRDFRHRYVRGPGYHMDENGEPKEEYWKQESKYSAEELSSRKPYRIEIVGVTCDPALAVARGVWRKLRTGRGVPISSQLRSHRLFSENFEHIAKLVDSATLYHTGTSLTTMTSTTSVAPKVIAHSSQVTRGEMLVNTSMWAKFQKFKKLNDNATGRDTLYQSTRKININFQQITKAFTEMRSRAKSTGTLQDSQQKG